MFHIFTKKRFLVDALHGFVDIHNHILPGIDDGAKTVEDSIAMIREFASFGVTKFIATPHIMNDYYPNTPETISDALILLKSKLLQQGIDSVSIEAAAEHMIDSQFDSLLQTKSIMPIRSQYLLIEMSYLQISINFDHAVERIKSAGLFPILAHPERYGYLHHKRSIWNGYKDKNILMQLNLLSLSAFYGKEVRANAYFLLNNGLIDYVASDIHNIGQLEYLKNISLSAKEMKLIITLIQKTINDFY